MKTETWWGIEKERPTWPEGPWNHEPDKVQWPDPATGLPCLMVRSRFGNWCGYVGVTKEHPWFQHPYQDHDDAIEVHGGLTYSDFCSGDEHGICHVDPQPCPHCVGDPAIGRVVTTCEDCRGSGEVEIPVWWFGFDCGHSFDYQPRMARYGDMPGMEGVVYRDMAYVKTQVEALALQIKAAA